MTETEMQWRIANDYGTRYAAIPNVSFAWQRGIYYPTRGQMEVSKNYSIAVKHEADLVLVGEDFIQEIEIKISYKDFLRDFRKPEHHLTRYTKYVWFAFPDTMWLKSAESIDNAISIFFAKAGIMIVSRGAGYGRKYTKSIKRPKPFPAEPLPKENWEHLMWSGVQKWWRKEKNNEILNQEGMEEKNHEEKK